MSKPEQVEPPSARVTGAQGLYLRSVTALERRLEERPVHEGEEAREYDGMVRGRSWYFRTPFVRMVARLRLQRARVLDIGSGPGWIPIELAKRSPGWEVWGIDASPEMVALARRHAEEAGVADRVHFCCGDATQLPFAHDHFDVTVSQFFLHHLDQPHVLFNEAARVTREGGRVLIRDLLRVPNWQSALLLGFSKHVLRFSASQMEMYRESLAAALTIQELRQVVRELASSEVTLRRSLVVNAVVDATIRKSMRQVSSP